MLAVSSQCAKAIIFSDVNLLHATLTILISALTTVGYLSRMIECVIPFIINAPINGEISIDLKLSAEMHLSAIIEIAKIEFKLVSHPFKPNNVQQ